MLFQACSLKNNARLVVMMLEVLAFPLDTNDVVNSLETMERKMKEFERYANIEIPEFLKISSRRRIDETHFIMNSHRLTTFQDIKTEVTIVKQAQSAEMAKTGDAMNVDAFSKGLSKGASKVARKGKDSEVVCWYCENKCHRASGRKKQKDLDKGHRRVRRRATAKVKATRRSTRASASSAAMWVTCRKIAGPMNRVHSKRATNAWRRPGASTWRAPT